MVILALLVPTPLGPTEEDRVDLKPYQRKLLNLTERQLLRLLVDHAGLDFINVKALKAPAPPFMCTFSIAVLGAWSIQRCSPWCLQQRSSCVPSALQSLVPWS